MIVRLRGTLVRRDAATVEVLTPSGVGYEVAVPTTVLERLPRLGEEVELRTLLVQRDDGPQLFGFLEPTERDLFARLLTIPGVGPRLALTLLSALNASRLIDVLRRRDVAALMQVSGVGRKTAERLVLELADKVQDLAASASAPVGGAVHDAVQALTVLGYDRLDVEPIVRALVAEQPGASTAEVVREALRRLR